MRKNLIIFIFISLISIIANSQNYKITGKISDAKNNTPLYGGAVVLSNVNDSTIIASTITDENGNFVLIAKNIQSYKLTINYLGYQKYFKIIEVKNDAEDIGTIKLFPKQQNIKEVVITGKIPPVVQKGDTTEMNAGAYKVNKDANAEDLAKKMPSITIENGNVKAQGEDVKKVLVDGKPFFGDDPSIAMKNIPADIIDKIQIYNKLSDQAELTGFDDGQSTKTLNIVTKPKNRNGTFGKAYAGYGDNEKYQAGGNINHFKDDLRITLVGMSNNINQQNFSSQDLFGSSGGGGKGGRGGGMNNFFVGQQSGISTTNSIGFNYTDDWGKKLKFNGSYFYNNSKNLQEQLINRQYINTTQFYKETDNSTTKNFNNRINMRLEYAFDTMNTLILAPRISFQKNNSTSLQFAENYNPENILNNSNNSSNSKTDGYNFSNDLTYRHKFKKKGRTISISSNASSNDKKPLSFLQSQNIFYLNSIAETDSINQRTNSENNGYSINSNLSYTEPIGKYSLLQLNYTNYYSNSNAEKLNYDLTKTLPANDYLDTALSNKYNSNYISNKYGVGYRYNKDKINASLNLNYQKADLSGNRTFPAVDKINHTFEDFLPSLMLRYKFSNYSNLMFNYRTNTNAPSISQLQNVIDNSNSLMLSTGNPDLRQEYSQSFVTRYSYTNKDKLTNFFSFFNASYTLHPISSTTITSFKDTLLANDFLMKKGTRLTYPINLDNKSWNVRTFLVYSFPIKFIKCNLNLNTGFNYSLTPGKINNLINLSNAYNISQGIGISSNISDKIDFLISYNGGYNIAKNTLQKENDNVYYTHTTSFKLNWTFWKGLVLQNEVTNQIYDGLSTSDFNQKFWLLNLSLAKKIFKNQQGEIKIGVFDLLKQNNSISRNVTSLYIEDLRNNSLQRYYMLTFTYTIKAFKGANDDDTKKNNEPRLMPFAPPQNQQTPSTPPPPMPPRDFH